MIQKIRQFVAEVITELKKVNWTSRRELLEAAWIVLVSSTVVAIFIFFIDFVLAKIITTIIS
ncbi:MAG: preprotein translocase subunit SecE [Candidatus Omnitrophica bacterium]|nr:preprotein translocase subunit SecE [Candidatus Omnitrophota bacterium]